MSRHETRDTSHSRDLISQIQILKNMVCKRTTIKCSLSFSYRNFLDEPSGKRSGERSCASVAVVFISPFSISVTEMFLTLFRKEMSVINVIRTSDGYF